jgi:hypothetical protein
MQTLWDLVPMLAKLLSLLSADLGLPRFVRHYWTDFPEICPARDRFCEALFRPKSLGASFVLA